MGGRGAEKSQKNEDKERNYTFLFAKKERQGEQGKEERVRVRHTQRSRKIKEEDPEGVDGLRWAGIGSEVSVGTFHLCGCPGEHTAL